MLNTEKKILTQEKEVKPNRFAAKILLFIIAIITLCLVLNELGIFRVQTRWMRIASGAAIAAMIVPLLIILDKRKLECHSTKYLIIASVIFATFCITVMLSFHSVLAYVLPMLVAMQYRSKRVGRIALIGSMVSAACAPAVGFFIKTWDTLFLEVLLELNGIGTANGAVEPAKATEALANIMGYMVLPYELFLILFGLVMFSVIRTDADNINGQIKLQQFSERDFLTGLYNQNAYKSLIESNNQSGKAGIMFFDIDGLKSANDFHGHEYGDLLIRRCAESIHRIEDHQTFGFRVGGDEFVVIIESGDKKLLEKKVRAWKNAMVTVNMENEQEYGGIKCSMAIGTAFGDMADLEDLIRHADTVMYEDKHRNSSARYRSIKPSEQ